MTTSTHNFGWNGFNDSAKAASENEKMAKRINRVLKKIGQPEVSNVGGASLEIIYDINKNSNISYIVEELRAASALGYTVNETVARLVEELK